MPCAWPHFHIVMQEQRKQPGTHCLCMCKLSIVNNLAIFTVVVMWTVNLSYFTDHIAHSCLLTKERLRLPSKLLIIPLSLLCAVPCTICYFHFCNIFQPHISTKSPFQRLTLRMTRFYTSLSSSKVWNRLQQIMRKLAYDARTSPDKVHVRMYTCHCCLESQKE